MSVPPEIRDFSPEQGLTFLEHLAHNLTIEVRIAADSHRSTSIEQSRKSMYWINEAIHNVVQLTRDLRIGRDQWDPERIERWVASWNSYKHAGEFNRRAVQRSIDETLHPWTG